MRVLVAILLMAGAAFQAHADSVPARFLSVSPGIYRSAQPDQEDLATLQKIYGIKTIIDLNDNQTAMANEARWTEQLGIKWIARPMSGFWTPNNYQVIHTLAMLADSGNYPVLVHCEHGEDRTGLIIGLYRVFVEKWSADAAYSEMLSDGFHQILIFLNQYFVEKTGLQATVQLDVKNR